MAFTEFCCRSGGSNLNAGTRLGDSTEPGTSASLTYASGSWVSATGVFTVASGDPVADGVAVGDFASVYADGASVTTLVGRVTARTTTTITVSTTARSGTTTDGTSNRTLRIGGAWAGPSGSSAFPFNFITNACTNSSGHRVRVNFKNDATYSVTAAMTHANAGPMQFEGYSSAYGDGGRATVDGGTSGAAYVVLTVSAANCKLCNFQFQNNGASSSSSLLTSSGDGNSILRCVFTGSRGNGLSVSATNDPCEVIECEAYGNNLSNTASLGGFSSSLNGNFVRCISHDNTGSNTAGFVGTNSRSVTFFHCVADTNGGIGFRGISGLTMLSCDAYNNGSHGASCEANGIYVENSNFCTNGGLGISISTGSIGTVINNGFGSGTAANASGQITSSATLAVDNLNSVTYASNVTPWTDPANGDFRINLAAARNAGRGAFLQTAASYAGTVGYPDIGAAQSQATGSGGGSLINSQQLVRQGWIG